MKHDQRDQIFGILLLFGLVIASAMALGADIPMKWSAIPLVLPCVGLIGYNVRKWLKAKRGETSDEQWERMEFQVKLDNAEKRRASRKRTTASNPPGDLYGSGNGQSEEEAVVIRTTSSSIGVPAEYAWLEKQYGLRDSDWSINLRMHGPDATGRIHEKFRIKLTDGTEKTIYFDISSFFGRP